MINLLRSKQILEWNINSVIILTYHLCWYVGKTKLYKYMKHLWYLEDKIPQGLISFEELLNTRNEWVLCCSRNFQ